MERWLVLQLRVATKDDFSNQFGEKKLGVIYFCQSATGIIEPKAHYFNEGICMKTFRQLYAAKQIYVPVFERSEIKEVEADSEELTN